MIKRLCKEMEVALGRSLRTPKDFDFLRERIYARLHLYVSSTTLKRVWGYLDDGGQPRATTLSVLAQFLGYQSWEEYVQNASLPKEQQSSPILNRRLSVTEELVRGDTLRLIWQPERVCDVEYLGGLTFRVMTSKNTRLKEGNTFECSLIVEGEPLYLDNLRQDGFPPIAYVCGKKSGVMFEFL